MKMSKVNDGAICYRLDQPRLLYLDYFRLE